MKICYKCKQEKELSEFCKDKRSKDNLNSRCRKCSHLCSSQYRTIYKSRVAKRHEKYRDEHREEIRERNREYRRTHKEQRNNFRKQKRKNDIEYKILCNLRYRMWSVVKNNRKCESTENLTGCSIEFLKQYLQFQFTTGMSWDNYGRIKNIRCWEIDHKKPCASFDLSKESEQRECFHYTNLQPLWAKENLIKGATYNGNSYHS